MNIKEWILLLVLLAGTVYNLDHTAARLGLLLVWGLLPILFTSIAVNVGSKALWELNYGLIVLFLLFITFLYNIDTLSLEFNGPNAERLTIFLYVFHVTLLYYFIQLNEKGVSIKFITYFMICVVVILLLDVLVRYIQAPQYFMNYSTRHQAKTIGFFSTTNVTGQIVSFLIAISWQIKFKFKKIIQFLMMVILATTMARSAIIALIITYAIYYVVQSNNRTTLLFVIGTALVSTLMLISDTFNLANDGSLISKLHFFEATYKLMINGSIGDIVFGYGGSYDAIVNAMNVSGWSPHVHILKAFLYYGVIGVLIFMFIIIHMFFQNKKMLFPLMVYLIFGLAGAPIYWPTLSVGLVLLLISDNYKKIKC